MPTSKNEFKYSTFATIVDKSRQLSNKKGYQCCIPNCKETALSHSHIVSQSVLKKYICDDKHQLIQCQIDEIHPMSATKSGESPFEKFTTIGISAAMSMPIFCKKHDNDLFYKYEGNADDIEPYDISFQVLQALRSIGALRYRESKQIEQNMFKASLDDFYAGWLYQEEIQMCKNFIRRYDVTISNLYEAIEKGDYNKFEFVCIELEQIKIAICDALIDNDDLEKHIMNDECDIPVKVLYINLIPKANNSYLFLGYDKTSVSDKQIALMNTWKSSLESSFHSKVLYDILCHCGNNWCISPNCDNRIIEYLKNNYSNDRINISY